MSLLITGVTSSTYFQRKSRIQIQRAGFVNQLDWTPECSSIPQICLFSMLSTPLNSNIDAINIWWCPKYTSTLQKQTLQKRVRNKRHAAPVAYDCGPKSNAHKLRLRTLRHVWQRLISIPGIRGLGKSEQLLGSPFDKDTHSSQGPDATKTLGLRIWWRREITWAWLRDEMQ